MVIIQRQHKHLFHLYLCVSNEEYQPKLERIHLEERWMRVQLSMIQQFKTSLMTSHQI